MRSWWTTRVKDYLTFSKKERYGILFLLGLIIVFITLSRYLPVKEEEYSKQSFQQELADLRITIDSTSHQKYVKEIPEYDVYGPVSEGTSNAKISFFTFDPNTITPSEWRKLGIRERTIQTIQKFKNKGFRFRRPDDLKRIYGLSVTEAEKLMPYVVINEAKPSFEEKSSEPVRTNYGERRFNVININNADTTDLIALPGVGSKLANRIINFRNRLGGFYTIEQVAETYGLPDSTFREIKKWLQCNIAEVKKLNINTATVDELKLHPYIKWNIARAIVNYRNEHGPFSRIEDLKKIDMMADDIFNKIAPYITT